MFVVVGGVLFGKDAIVTKAVKGYFHRDRPNWDLHHSFSFPSGHSTSVYFTLATLFFVVLPAYKYIAYGDEAASSEGSSSSGEDSTFLKSALDKVTQPASALALTVSGGVVTQTGRLLADVHWFSDVMAGMCFGSCGAILLYLGLTRANVIPRS